ncbi:MAG: ABC transporter ATP-binding protein [Bacillota bacterium]
MSLLEVKNVTKRFQGLVANDDVSFHIDEGEIVSLIGPNGAGKTTLFSCVAGSHRIDRGDIRFRGHPITNRSPNAICAAGLARTFQVVRIFNNMTTLENTLIGAFLHTSDPRHALREAMAVLELTGLADKKDFLGANLTIADRKRLEVARALATRPKLLLLDEVMAGLTTTEMKEAVELVKKINAQGVTLLIVEHVMEAIMPISHRILVLDSGKKIAEGEPRAIVSDPRVIQAYLGEKYRAQNN